MNKQRGFTAIEIIIVFVIIVAVATITWLVATRQQEQKPVPNTNAINQDTGGPAPGQTVANKIEQITGSWIPAKIIIKKGESVTWVVNTGGEIPRYAVESDLNSAERFSSPDLPTGSKFTHTFSKVGTFGWHDKYDGSLSGYTVTVIE
jgi:plastocyanin